MDLFLDMKTTFISLVVGHLFTVILISSYWKDYKRDSTFNSFFLAKCVQAIAWMLLALRGGIPDVWTISIANTLLFLGASLEAVAVLKLQRAFHPILKKMYIILTIINLVGFHLVILFYNEESMRIAFASIGTAILAITPAYKLLLRKPSSSLAKIMGFLYFLVFISLFGRGLTALWSTPSMGLFTPGITQTLSFLTLYLVMIMGNMGFVLLLKESVDLELKRLASTDDLIGILNRRAFISLTKQHIIDCAKKQVPSSLLMFDIDHFKRINDTQGHDMGDQVLQDLSHRINQILRPQDLFSRFGGEEFAILLPGMNERESTNCAENIRKMITDTVDPKLPVHYTLSLGLLTVLPDQETDWQTLYRLCDKALYHAKNKGRDQVSRSDLSP